MTAFKAGQFEVIVDGPYPCWITVRAGEINGYGDQVQMRFEHQQIADLLFVLERARQEARRKLGKDADEVL